MCISLDSLNVPAAPEDVTPVVADISEPTEPGFYKYSGGNQNMIFLLTSGTWYTVFDNANIHVCKWGYIEQALGVWQLVKI